MTTELDFRPASRTTAIKPSDVLEMMRIAKDLEQQGETVHYLVQGEPDFDTPEHIKEAAYRAMLDGYTHYPPAEGFPELRKAVADTLLEAYGLDYDPSAEILVTNGAALGLYLAVNAVIEPGDEVLITDPSYGAYSMLIESAGGKVVWVTTHDAANGRSTIDLDELRNRVTSKTKAILLCNPDNPTGRVLTEEALRSIGETAVEHDLVVITDEVYEKFLFDGEKHVPFASLDPRFRERCILVNSFSKTYAMTGWRLGYNAAPPKLMQAMKQMNAVAGRAAAAFVQQAGITALTGPQDDVAAMVSEYAARRSMLLDSLASIDEISYSIPQGGFYVWVDFSRYSTDSRAFAQELLTRGGVVLTPGDYYGPAGAGHLRFSFACSREAIRGGLEGLRRALTGLKASGAERSLA